MQATAGPSNQHSGSIGKHLVRRQVQRRNLDGFLEALMEPVARQARRHVVEEINRADR